MTEKLAPDHNYDITFRSPCQVSLADLTLDLRYNITMRESFLLWVNNELARRAWRNADLAREGDLSESMVSRVLNGGSRVTFDFCLGIARAFDIRPEPLFRYAGLSPPLAAEVECEEEILEAIRRLKPHAREVILQAIRGLARDTPPAPDPTLGQTAKDRERGIPTPRRGDVDLPIISNLEPGDPIRDRLEDYVSIPRSPDDLHLRLTVLFHLMQDALNDLQEKLMAAQNGMSPDNDVNHSSKSICVICQLPHIINYFCVWPMLPQYLLRVFVVLAKRDCLIATHQLFASVTEAANAAEQVKHPKHQDPRPCTGPHCTLTTGGTS